MARVLVTGGAGFVGAHACKALAAAGYEPVVFDNFATGWRDAVRFGPMIEGDLLDRPALDAAFAATAPAAVMHFAALSLVGESVANPGCYWRVNVGGSLNLLEAMRAAGVRRLVFSSTAAVYGEPDLALISEDSETRPTNPYGATKLAVERMIGDFGVAHGIEAVRFRYFNVAGSDPDGRIGEDHRPETHLIPLALQAASGRRSGLTIFGDDYPTPDGACVRDYIHADDLAEAHVLGLLRLLAGESGGVYNLGLGRGFSVFEVVAAVKAVTGLDVPATVGPRRPGDPARLVCDPTRAMTELGWRPRRMALETMIGDAFAWSQRGGYAR